MTTQEMINELRNTKTIETKTFAVGGGEWSIEVSGDNGFMFELVGSNGTRNDEEADDLWAELAELEKLAK